MKSLLTLALIASALVAVTLLPRTTVEAVNNSSQTLANYDIRVDPSPDAHRFRAEVDNSLIQRFKIERNDLGAVEVIEPVDGKNLLARRVRDRGEALLDFILSNRDVFGEVDRRTLLETADYTNPDGHLSFVSLEQRANGVPVFGAEVRAGFSRSGEMFRVVNNLARDLDPDTLPSDFGRPETAVAAAARLIDLLLNPNDLTRVDSDRIATFVAPNFPDRITAERFYFPIDGGVVRTAWRVLLWKDHRAFYIVVDAETGTLLWRKMLTEEQVLPATYNVYGNSTSLLRTADSPSPFSPGCVAPIGCPQPPAVPRTSFTLIGNEAPYAFNSLGWIPDTGLPVRTPANANITDGNNVEAGIDRQAPTGVDDNGWAFGSPTRVFNQPYNPGPGLPPPGEEPLPTTQTYPPSAFQQGSIAHGFYTINRWHDELYRFGFTEQARNFQHFNFGRGGVEGDRISLEIQDSSGTNFANFTTVADGGRPRLQVSIFTGPTPDRDGALDAEVVTHEMTHGLSGRLIGNTTGLGSNMARGMGEGWSDFYAIALLSEPTDNRLGTHPFAGYVSYQLVTDFDANYYYGLRRFPYAVWASRGANGLPHNPLTFRYINADCNTHIGTSTTNPNSAFPRGPIGSTSPCDQIHNLGETWAVTLWEVRGQLIERHGAAEGTRRVLQYVTDGMKLSPLNPTVVQMRDSILSAVAVSDPADLASVWRGFAIRGLGQAAAVIVPGSGSNNTVVTESFALPVQYRRPARADFDGDGRTDVSVFRPSDRIWYLNRSTAGFAGIAWGLATDRVVPDDFDGDGKTDVAVFRATADGSMPDYYILRSSDSTVSYFYWGTTGDISVSEDFDADNRADATIYRPSTGEFWFRNTDGSGAPSSPMAGTPIVGDWDGDGRGDFGTFNDGVWRIRRSGQGWASVTVVGWGLAGDKPVHADYDGDGRDDIAVYRPSEGMWYIAASAGGHRFIQFGISTDIPAPGDYDGDSRADVAIYRDGLWYINGSTSGVVITRFGLPGDQPLPASHIP